MHTVYYLVRAQNSYQSLYSYYELVASTRVYIYIYNAYELVYYIRRTLVIRVNASALP